LELNYYYGLGLLTGVLRHLMINPED